MDTPAASIQTESSISDDVEKAELGGEGPGSVHAQESVIELKETNHVSSKSTPAEIESSIAQTKVSNSTRESSDESKTLSLHSDNEAAQPPVENNGKIISSSHHLPLPNDTLDLNGKPTPTAHNAKPPGVWANLFRGSVASPAAPPTNSVISTTETSSRTSSAVSKPKDNILADALKAYVVSASKNKTAFLEPRGLVNMGQMCYMNSVGIRWLSTWFIS